MPARQFAPLLAIALAACGEARTPPDPGVTSGPTGTTVARCVGAGIGQPTWAAFAATFFASYCTRCHGSTVVGPARNGAPTDHNFDSYAGAKLWASQMDRMAAASPDGTVVNTFMPPEGASPGLEDRKRLACWIAGDAPP